MLHRLRFIPGRILQAIPVALGVSILVFLMSHLLPGNPAVAILGNHATPAGVAALSKHLGLDKPLWEQYWLFLVHLFQGDLGTSLTYQQPVVGLVFSAVPVTLSLVLYALVLSLIISVPLAGWAATKPGHARDLGVRAYTPELLAPALCGCTGRELLRGRHLAFSASHRLLCAPRSSPCAGHRFDSAPNPYALRQSRIAPLPTPCVRAGHGSLRATDCSVVQHLELRPAHGLLRTRHLVLPNDDGLLRSRCVARCTNPGLLRARYLALRAGLRIAPYSDTLRPACQPRIAPCSAL
jgi:hypothetical protein